MDGLQERVDLAIKSGDVTELQKLLGSDWGRSWTTKRAEQVYREIVSGNGKSLTTGQALHHALLIALSMGNELAIARAERVALQKRIEELEARVGDLRMRGMEYLGVWTSENAPFRPGQVVTDKSTLWYCKEVTYERPPSDCWQLMSKNHR